MGETIRGSVGEGDVAGPAVQVILVEVAHLQVAADPALVVHRLHQIPAGGEVGEDLVVLEDDIAGVLAHHLAVVAAAVASLPDHVQGRIVVIKSVALKRVGINKANHLGLSMAEALPVRVHRGHNRLEQRTTQRNKRRKILHLYLPNDWVIV